MSSSMVVAVVVTYHPEPGSLQRLAHCLAGQVTHVLVVDNGTPDDSRPLMAPTVECLRLDDNLGLGAAQNHGIAWARERGADAVLLMDQDSEPAGDMVARLETAWRDLERQGHHVAALGPNYSDPRVDHRSPFHRVRGLRLERPGCPDDGAVVEVDHLTASGSLIPLASLARVGPMDDALFIDYVDVEWGLRASHHGLQCFGVCGALMRHPLGDEPLRAFGRRYVRHSPLRNYYYFRNAFALMRRRWVPWNWKLVELRRLVLRMGLYLTADPARFRHLGMIARGVFHGLIGRSGRL